MCLIALDAVARISWLWQCALIMVNQPLILNKNHIEPFTHLVSSLQGMNWTPRCFLEFDHIRNAKRDYFTTHYVVLSVNASVLAGSRNHRKFLRSTFSQAEQHCCWCLKHTFVQVHNYHMQISMISLHEEECAHRSLPSATRSPYPFPFKTLPRHGSFDTICQDDYDNIKTIVWLDFQYSKLII